MTDLVRYDQMCQAIAECRRVDEVKDLRDKALALERYLQQANNLEAEAQAREVRMRAERKVGELLRDQKASGERASAGGNRGNQHTGGIVVSDDNATLSDLGVTRDQSSQWQQLAEIPEEEFDEYLDDRDSKPTTGSILRRHRRRTGAEPASAGIRVNPEALALWGYIRDVAALRLEPSQLVRTMTPSMVEQINAQLPEVIAFLRNLEGPIHERHANRTGQGDDSDVLRRASGKGCNLH